MICKSEAKRMCTDYTKIKNYDKAIADNTQTWCVHHIYELKCPVRKFSMSELKAMGMYYHRPPKELIFMTASEHHKLHQNINNSFKGKKHTEESRLKMSKNNKRFYLGKHIPEKTKEKLREANLGKKHDNSFCENISKRNKGRKWFTDGVHNKYCFECPKGYRLGRSEYSYRGVMKQNSKKTLCITTGKVFESATEAAKFYKLLDACVRRAARNNSTYGMYNNQHLEWSYL